MTTNSFATLIIPCAGKGSRLGFDSPKCLAEIGNQTTILRKIILEIESLFSELVLVVSQEGLEEISNEIDSIGKISKLPIVKFVIQPAPIGSLNAVNLGLTSSTNHKIVIAWGDQIGLKKRTVSKILNSLEKHRVVVPTTLTRKPYVWIVRDRRKFAIAGMGRSRDGDHSPMFGFADLGVFGVHKSVQKYFEEEELSLSRSNSEKEQDFVYALAASNISKKTHLIFSWNFGQTKAINTPEELAHARKYHR